MFTKNACFDDLQRSVCVLENTYRFNPSLEEALLIFKPDAFVKKDPITLLTMYQSVRDDLKLLAQIKLIKVSVYAHIDMQTYPYADDLLATHYAEHVNKPFYPELRAYMKGEAGYPHKPVFVVVQGLPGTVQLLREYALKELRGKQFVAKEYTPEFRKLILGLEENAPGAYVSQVRPTDNILHVSDSVEAGQREVKNILQHLGIEPK